MYICIECGKTYEAPTVSFICNNPSCRGKGKTGLLVHESSFDEKSLNSLRQKNIEETQTALKGRRNTGAIALTISLGLLAILAILYRQGNQQFLTHYESALYYAELDNPFLARQSINTAMNSAWLASGQKKAELRTLEGQLWERMNEEFYNALIGGYYRVEPAEMLKNGVDPNYLLKDKAPFITTAAAMGDADLVKLLIENGANCADRRACLDLIDFGGQGSVGSPAVAAAIYGHTEVLRYFQEVCPEVLQQPEAQCEPDIDFRYTPLSAAIANGQNEVATYLFDQGITTPAEVIVDYAPLYVTPELDAEAVGTIRYGTSITISGHELTETENAYQIKSTAAAAYQSGLQSLTLKQGTVLLRTDPNDYYYFARSFNGNELKILSSEDYFNGYYYPEKSGFFYQFSLAGETIYVSPDDLVRTAAINWLRVEYDNQEGWLIGSAVELKG